MLDIIFVLLFLFAVILMLYCLIDFNPVFCIVDSIIWILLALFMLQGIETPYTMYNSSSGNIESGLQIVQTNLTPLAYVFMLLGVIMFIMFVTLSFQAFSSRKKL
jgi:hypothetical protein